MDDKCVLRAVVMRKIGRYHPEKAILPGMKCKDSGMIFIPKPINSGIKKSFYVFIFWCFAFVSYIGSLWFISVFGLMAWRF